MNNLIKNRGYPLDVEVGVIFPHFEKKTHPIVIWEELWVRWLAVILLRDLIRCEITAGFLSYPGWLFWSRLDQTPNYQRRFFTTMPTQVDGKKVNTPKKNYLPTPLIKIYINSKYNFSNHISHHGTYSFACEAFHISITLMDQRHVFLTCIVDGKYVTT
jgi:hypothetical protein